MIIGTVTIPAYQTTTVTLKATEQIEEVTADAANYKYFLTFRTLVIPEYNTDEIARGRYEWSSMVGAYEFVFNPMAELHPLVDGEYTIATNSASVQGGVSYRSLYFTSSTGISIYVKTAKEVFQRRQGDCAGISSAFYVLCKKNKIPCRYIIGWTDSGCHAWNKVKIGKRWYWCDATLGIWMRKKLPKGWSVMEMW